MSRLSLAFFSLGALCVMAGMVWGSMMGSSQDFTLAPAHAHLNLVGWASLGLMGAFYAVSGRGGRLGWANFAFSGLGVVVMVPSLAMYLSGKSMFQPGVIAGSAMAMIGMALFVIVVLTSWRGAKAA